MRHGKYKGKHPDWVGQSALLMLDKAHPTYFLAQMDDMTHNMELSHSWTLLPVSDWEIDQYTLTDIFWVTVRNKFEEVKADPQACGKVRIKDFEDRVFELWKRSLPSG